jgi:repressor LexA
VGRVAAGGLTEAVEHIEKQIMMDPSLLKGGGETFALKVRGDSMIDEGIRDGDTVVVEHRTHARNGEVVVALIDGTEATLKRIEQKSGQVVLHPANTAMSPLVFRPERVTIRGVVKGLIRRY